MYGMAILLSCSMAMCRLGSETSAATHVSRATCGDERRAACLQIQVEERTMQEAFWNPFCRATFNHPGPAATSPITTILPRNHPSTHKTQSNPNLFPRILHTTLATLSTCRLFTTRRIS
jgi:hypothetical protein